MNTFQLKSIRYRAEIEVFENKTGSQMSGKIYQSTKLSLKNGIFIHWRNEPKLNEFRH